MFCIRCSCEHSEAVEFDIAGEAFRNCLTTCGALRATEEVEWQQPGRPGAYAAGTMAAATLVGRSDCITAGLHASSSLSFWSDRYDGQARNNTDRTTP